MNTQNSPPYPALLSSVLNAQTTATLLLDETGVITFANTGFSRLGLFDPIALLGTHISTHCHTADHASLDALLAHTPKDDSNKPNYAVRIISQNGTPLVLRAQPLADQNGTSLGFLCKNGNDRETQQSALRQAGLAIWDTGGPKGQSLVSDEWFHIRGIKDPHPNQVRDWLDHVHPDDKSNLIDLQDRRNQGEEVDQQTEYRVRYDTKDWIWIQSTSRVLETDTQGRPLRIVGTDQDITATKDMQTRHFAAMARLQLALKVAELGVWQYNHDTKTVHWDDQMLKIYGITDGKNLRSSEEWPTRLHPDDREQTTSLAVACIRGQSEFTHDFRIIREDGAVRYVRSRARMSPDPASNGFLVTGMSIDITDDRQKTHDLELAHATMEYESRHDVLTGLANRRRLDEYHESLEHQAKATGSPFIFHVLHMDLDRFKQINDTMGHAAGDAVLRHFSAALTAITGPHGLAARVGGDEFVVLLAGHHTPSNLEIIADEIINATARPFFFEGQLCNYGISIGIAGHSPKHDDDSNITTFVNADLALYEAKLAGRNCACHFEPRMRVEALARRTMADDVTKAIRDDEFRCYYQPQFCARTGKLIGLEALVRWLCPGQGILTPGAFLPTVAANGHAVKLDEWVLKTVLAHQEQWAADGLLVPAVSVNLSSDRLLDPNLARSINQLDIPNNQIRFELLETTFLDEDEDQDVLTTNIQFLRDAGFELEIDDFGSGHASILGFIKIAPSRLKIDKGLIKPIVTSAAQREIVRAIVNIAKLCNAGVVAEGIESVDHARVATELGCDILQGFGLARPMPERDVRSLLENTPPRA